MYASGQKLQEMVTVKVTRDPKHQSMINSISCGDCMANYYGEDGSGTEQKNKGAEERLSFQQNHKLSFFMGMNTETCQGGKVQRLYTKVLKRGRGS